MSWNQYDPCPNCGNKDFAQVVTQTEDIILDDEHNDVERFEAVSMDVKEIYCRKCGKTVSAQ